ncbi:MAG: tetratricopeptide repeat protein [bacterium]|nr:tetratricopeptide repeat protein [bacterium]
MSNSDSPKKTWLPAFAAAILLIAGLFAHANGLEGPFVYDDGIAIVNNESIRGFSSAWSPPRHTPLAGRPVVNLTLAANYAFGTLEPRGYRVTNLGLHLLAALLLFALLRRTLSGFTSGPARTPADGLAFAAALLWTLHPLQTESIYYVTQRSELVVALFYLATLYCSARAIESSKSQIWFVAAVTACALGMASKEVMVTAPLIVFLQHASCGSGTLREVFARNRRLYLSLAATWSVLALLMLDGPRSDTIGFSHGIGAVEYIFAQGGVILDYLAHSFWPNLLVFDYGPAEAISLTGALPEVLLVGALLALSCWAFARERRLGFWAVWVFVILSPTSSFIPILTEVGAERRMYLPLVGVCVLGVVLAARILGRFTQEPRIRLLAATTSLAIVAAALSNVTARRAHDYTSRVNLWASAVHARPNLVRPRVNLGQQLSLVGRNPEAEVQFRRALEIDPDEMLAHLNLGLILQARGEFEAAISHFRRTAELNPAIVQAHYSLALAYRSLGQHTRALESAHVGLEVATATGRPNWAARLESVIRSLARPRPR